MCFEIFGLRDAFERGFKTKRGAGKAISMDDSTGAKRDRHLDPMHAESQHAERIELNCPGCGFELAGDDHFDRFRVCAGCGRHFGIPARERIKLLVDRGGFEETSGQLVSLDPVRFHDKLPVADRLADAQERSAVAEAVITGVADIGGHQAVLVALDSAFIGGALGVLAGEKVAVAFDLALSRRLPFIAICAGGGVRTQDGMLAVLQMAKLATLAARIHRAGLPMISVMTHPTTGGIYAGLANQADFILAEPGTIAGGLPAAGQGLSAEIPTAEELLAAGLIDDVVERPMLRDRLSAIMHLLCARGSLHVPFDNLPELGPTTPTWETLRIGRDPHRPSAATFARRSMSIFQPLRGDRAGSDDEGMLCGIGRFEGMTVAVIAHERQPLDDGFAPLSAGAFRKAARMMQLAGRLEMPLLSFVDTPGAATGLEAELAGVSMAVAHNLSLMGQLPAPVIAIITGEAGGAGSLANSLGDRILVLEHGRFSLPMTEGATTHPFFHRPQDASQPRMSRSISMGARDAKVLGVVDAIVPEPEGGAHLAPDEAEALLRSAVAQHLGEVLASGPRRLIDDRMRRARSLGLAAPESDETVRRELRELHALQHSVSRSIDDFRNDMRDRWDRQRQALPQIPVRLPKRPDLNDLANRLTSLRESVATASARFDRSQTLPQDDDVESVEKES
jgi:acetyl-CoA carboxylase carboxyl transferase beta subunit